MSPLQPDPDRELILAHVPYVRGLARQLVFDADLAQDVEQEVLLAALENAPRDPRSLKAWLAAVLRHLASKAFRARERRAEREEARDVPAVPAPAEILAREDQRRALVERVLALEPSVRDVLILRYFEDLPPRAVARRLGIPVETVRTRAKRGVELLRAQLEREPGGRRGAWCLALVAGLKLEPPSLALAGASVAAASLPGVVAMSLSKKIVAVAAVVACASWITFKSGIPAAPKSAQVLASPEPSALVAPPREAPAPVQPAESRAAVEVQERAPSAPAPAAETGSLLLTVHWHDGTPAAGVNARLHQVGVDFYADVLDVATGEDGTLRVEDLHPGHVSVYLDRGLAKGCVIEAGVETALEFTIPRGFDIAGRVVEPGGRAVAGADILLDQMGGGWNGHVVARSDAGGRFAIRSVEEGLAWVSARAALHAPSPQLELVGSALAVEEIELVIEPVGAALAGVVLGHDGLPLAGARLLVGPEDAYEQLYFDGGGRGRVAAGQSVLTDERGRFAVAGIPVGRVAVQARGPGHAPWKGEIEGVDRRTAQLEIRLARCSTLAGRVTDGEGRPVARAEVYGNQPHSFAARYTRTAEDGTFQMRDLPVGEFPVSVEAEGFEGAKAVLAAAPGAELTWNPVLGSGLAIRGRLVMQGTDFTTWYVVCQSQDWARSPMRADVHPDANGSFVIPGCADVPHSIEVHAPNSMWAFPAAQRRDIAPGGSELVFELDDDCLPSCTLRGRFADAAGQPLAGLNYVLAREGNNVAPSLTTGADGSFEVGPYPPGRYRLAVHDAEFATYTGPFLDVAAGRSADFGEIRLERGGTIAARLLRDPAVQHAKVSVTAQPIGAADTRWMALQDDVARSETLPPGEYLVRVRGFEAVDSIAQGTARVSVLAGEEAQVELRVEAGVRLDFVWTDAPTQGVDVQVLDAAGAVVCEERLGPHDSLVVPVRSVRCLARDSAGHSADVALAFAAGTAVHELRVELQ